MKSKFSQVFKVKLSTKHKLKSERFLNLTKESFLDSIIKSIWGILKQNSLTPRAYGIAFLILFISAQAAANEKKGIETKAIESPSPIPAKEAEKKGVLRIRLASWPKSINYYTSGDVYTASISYFTHGSLLFKSPVNWQLEPMIAETWTVSPDFRTLTYQINPKATFVTGNPVTAEDVKFTFDLIYDPKRCINCEAQRGYIGSIEKVEVLGEKTVRFTMKNVDFLNVDRVGRAIILEKKVYEKGNFNRDYERRPDGAGPYAYDPKESTMRGRIVLRLREDNWLLAYPHFRNHFNFKKIIMKYIDDDAVAFEAFKRKDLDLLYFDAPMLKFWTRRDKAPFTNPDLVTLSSPKIVPWQWAGVALNMRQGPTADLKFRKALQVLLNRELILSKIFKNLQEPLSGPFPKGTAVSSNTPPVKFDPAEARRLLKEAGFVKADDTGILYRDITKDGKKERQRASLTVMYGTAAHDQWMTIWKDDAKKVGVEIIPRLSDWSAASKLVDEFKFEGFVIGWVGDPEPTPRQQWHSAGAKQNGSSNMPGFSDPEVDRLIDLAPSLADVEKRNAAFREIEKRIIEGQPYIFRWGLMTHYTAYWKDKVDPGETPFMKFSGDMYRNIFHTHWQKAKE
jgi:ABC-type transport system substrate-binding protein